MGIREIRTYQVKCDGGVCCASSMKSVDGDVWKVMGDLQKDGWSYHVALDTVLCPKCTALLNTGAVAKAGGF